MPTSMFDLTGQVAVVTGSGTGLGKTLAIGLAAAGADVAVTELPGREQLAEEAVSDIARLGRKAMAVPLDVTKMASIEHMVDRVAEHFGKIDILVNNAGINIRKPSLDVTEEDWDAVVNVNLKGNFFTSQAVARMMKERKRGKIVNIASINGLFGFSNRAAYCASKGGVVNLTRALAIDWADYGIRVNAIAPNYTRTPMTENILQDPDFVRDVLYRTPLKRIGTPEDLIGAVIYLSSSASDFMTGQTLAVDGGWTIW